MAYICQCGCGQEIPPSRFHGKVYEPKYMNGHASRSPEMRAQVSAKLKQTFAAKREGSMQDRPIYICQCGCGEQIPWKEQHRYRKPRYILEHYLKLGTSSRIERSREAHKLLRTAPPEGWTPPSGLCECGCGQPTKIADKARPERGEYTGYPRRYVFGHQAHAIRGKHTKRVVGERASMQRGYIRLFMPDYPGATRDGWVLEHRYIYETTRGIRLPRHVAVHHLNGIKHDNRPENLVAMTHMEHRRAHQIANSMISLLLDERLNAAACEYARAHGEMPDIQALTEAVYSPPAEQHPIP